VQYFIGFVIAMFIALTGVGAGTLTVPILVLFLHVPAPAAVAIGLTFSAAVKLVLVPAQIFRRQVSWRVLGYMLLGGLPGVLIGSLVLRHLVNAGSQNLTNALLGAILVGTASWQIITLIRPMKWNPNAADRSHLLPWLMFPVGAEVGFSSAGAGALGSAALLALSALTPTQVVGTDIAFGFAMSLIGSGAHWFSTSADPAMLTRLILGGVCGAIAGTLVSSSVPRRALRFALWIWLLLLGGEFLVHSYQVFTAAR
jgi:uncharacterized membrane protein YfcA